MSASFTSSDISPTSYQQKQENRVLNDDLAQSSASLLTQTTNKSHMTSFRELASSSCELQLCCSNNAFFGTTTSQSIQSFKQQTKSPTILRESLNLNGLLYI